MRIIAKIPNKIFVVFFIIYVARVIFDKNSADALFIKK